MFRNHLKLVMRKLRKERVYSFVNILGLTIGLTAFLLIGLYVRDELSFDKFHSRANEIYRLTNFNEVSTKRNTYTPPDFAEYIQQDAPEVESFVRIKTQGLNNLIATGESAFYTGGLIYSDANFFSFFDFNVLNGKPELVLASPKSVVLTESFAMKLFGRIDVVGEELTFNKTDKYQVLGVCADVPKNSSIQFDLVARGDDKTFENTFSKGYLAAATTFLMVPESADVANLESKVNNGIRQKPDYFRVKGDVYYELGSLNDIRLYSNFEGDPLETNDAKVVFLFTGIGLVILLLAVINYINLVTAQSIKNFKEIGLRKVLGATRGQLVRYHLLESTVIAFNSFVGSFAIAERIIPLFNSVLNKQVSLNYLSSDFVIWTLVFGLLLGLLSGLYPAFFITRVSPLTLLQKSATSIGSKGLFRKILVLFQFTVSAILIVTLVIMSSQMRYLDTQKLGFDKDNLISIPLYDNSLEVAELLKSELLKVPGVQSISTNDWRFGGGTSSDRFNNAYLKEVEPKPIVTESDMVQADKDFLKTMSLKVLYASKAYQEETLSEHQVIVNESLVKVFGWPENAVGQKVFQYGNISKEVVAVVKDFHTYSMKEEKAPLVIESFSYPFASNLLLRLNTNEAKESLAQMGKSYQSITDRPFEYYYVDDKIASYYKVENGQFKLFQAFSFLAMFISLLGLVALTIYIIEQRRKEVSIRKVLGATFQRLIFMLNKEYTILIVIAFLIATPVAYYAMQDWLAEFKYNVSISPLLFVGAFFGFLLLSWLVTLFPSLKVTNENPVEILRNE
ncbi:FtsX-like permease family protein [uncultured Roseivirga sp.]|uniref:FtsX-like permease family protein n=1 Tax=uncultured Roseivirga sp. TaxID=543088 RepID=UPI0030D8E81A|tara:strand:- start:417066 stop:419441 length:2376 start_codon:yes stop_codon:yes gene_type:complete